MKIMWNEIGNKMTSMRIRLVTTNASFVDLSLIPGTVYFQQKLYLWFKELSIKLTSGTNYNMLVNK